MHRGEVIRTWDSRAQPAEGQRAQLAEGAGGSGERGG